MSYATSLYLTGAEVGLSLTGLVMLLVAAWTGTRSARMLTIVTVAAKEAMVIAAIAAVEMLSWPSARP